MVGGVDDLTPAAVAALKSVPLLVGGPITAVVLVAMLWPGLTGVGSLLGLLVSHALAVLRVLWQLSIASSSAPPPAAGFEFVVVHSTLLTFGVVTGACCRRVGVM